MFEGLPAVDHLKKGLEDLTKVCQHVLTTFEVKPNSLMNEQQCLKAMFSDVNLVYNVCLAVILHDEASIMLYPKVDSYASVANECYYDVPALFTS